MPSGCGAHGCLPIKFAIHVALAGDGASFLGNRPSMTFYGPMCSTKYHIMDMLARKTRNHAACQISLAIRGPSLSLPLLHGYHATPSRAKTRVAIKE
jgi:hypothetical protein